MSGEKNVETPMLPKNIKAVYEKGTPKKEGLFDPDSVSVQLICWLYTMEPHFYSDMAQACREMKDS